MTANQHYDVIMIIGSGPEAKTLVYGLAPWLEGPSATEARRALGSVV